MKTLLCQFNRMDGLFRVTFGWRPALILLGLWSLFALSAQGQTREWDKTLGGDLEEGLWVLQQTREGGYLVGGWSESDSSGEKSQPGLGGGDYWVVKLDTAGNKLWDKTLGGSEDDILTALQQTTDGGYILGGNSDSDISGDKTQASKGGSDYWVVKLDSAGNKLWDRSFGGEDDDYIFAILQTRQGGYLLGGYSSSTRSGDKSEDSRGSSDYWVVKLDSAGNKVWDKTLGGTEYEVLTAVQQTTDGGFILGGDSDSDASGEKTEASRGFEDYWVVKLDSAGNKLWDKTLGGSEREAFSALEQTIDGGFILGGDSDSDISGEKSQASQGEADFWIVKLDSAGNKTWDRSFGGSGYEGLAGLQQTRDGGYFLGGGSDSGVGGDKTEPLVGVCDTTGYCPTDYWVLKLDSAGTRQWDKTLGGTGTDFLFVLQQTIDGGYILGGDSDSDISGDKTEGRRGICYDTICTTDFWVVKMKEDLLPTTARIRSVLPNKEVPGTLVTIRGNNLLTTRAVRFNGLDATFTVVNDELVTALVPVQATTGKITLVTAQGTIISPGSFLVRHPGITLYIPDQGAVGDTVSLEGVRLTKAEEVYFGGVKAREFNVLSDTTMTAVVPEGARIGRIKVVLAGGGYGISQTKFRVIPPEEAPARAKAEPGPDARRRAIKDPGKVYSTAAFPNPFRTQVSYGFSLPQAQPVTVKVYDLLGREVGLLYQGPAQARQHYQVEWQPLEHLSSGPYIIRLQTPGQVRQTKVLLTR